MIKKLLLLFLLSCALNGFAQVTNEGLPASWDISESESSLTPIILNQIDLKKIRSEDEINDKIKSKPYRIGVSKKVDIGLNNGGTWTELANGDRIWRAFFNSKDAVHLGVIFDKYHLPNGAKVYLYNDDKTDLLGAYTEIQNNEKNVLSTWFVNGDKLWVEYYEPKEVKGQGLLHLSTVSHGYRLGHTYQKGYKDSFLKINESSDCNHDVDCPIGIDFEDQKDLLKKSVGFLLMPDPEDDTYVCSGALINNTSEDRTPYFLTANHCSGTPPELYKIRFNWISPNPVCAATTDSTDSPDNFTLTGATVKASNAESDMMLLEINAAIPEAWDVTFAGWDKTGTDPTFEVGIHHPQGDIMKISRDDTGATKINASGTQAWLIGGTSAGTGDGWEIGVTEGGSSGSPLFNQDGRIIGQLYGGLANCTGTSDNNEYDVYGRFDVSWDTGLTQATRLKEWLDPTNSNPNTLEALENVLAVNDEFLEQNITVFPNPTSGKVEVKTTGLIGDLHYEIYNVLGQTLKSNTLNNQESIQLGNLPNDIYFIRITEITSNRSLVKKIVLSK